MKKTLNTENLISAIGKPVLRRFILDDTLAFLAVARQGTLSSAAASLNIGIATLSRHIDRLEEALDVPLFVRHQTGYRLTGDGSDLMHRAEAVEAAAQAFVSGVDARATMTGKVRLATAGNLASELVLPALPAFRARHPGLMIEIITGINAVNLHRRDADLAVRMVKPERGNVTLRKLAMLGYGLYASLGYADARQVRPDDNSYDHDELIAWNEEQSHLPAAQWIERALHGRQPALTTTSLSTQIAAAKAGLGLAVIPHFLAARAGGLVCIAADIGIDQPIYLVIQSDLAHSRRIRALADFLSNLVIENRARLSG